MYVCIYVCMYVCMCVYMCIHCVYMTHVYTQMSHADGLVVPLMETNYNHYVAGYPDPRPPGGHGLYLTETGGGGGGGGGVGGGE